MATYGYKDVQFQIDDDEGGTLEDLSDYLISISGIGVADTLEETHAAGDEWVEQTSAGLKRGDNITCVFLYDDTAAKVKDVFANSVGEVRSVSIDNGATTDSGEVVVQKTTKQMARGQVTKLEVILVWHGEITEA